ncbi:39S ribosomal protein L44, mitochondrial [Sitophilus oryzae]|uniref:Large ribosomal subunit protein mL44 n=1 Tax=Sitophilus oryzae TaxID=7048 RepID=A0A6J2Y766_SITOR|nr:39S ribosomal protein L44, mitochondrial [Sitophilus oryzae]
MFCRHILQATNRLIGQSSMNIQYIGCRNIKRWVAPTMKELSRRRKKVGPDPNKPRSSYLEWNYDVELHCFQNRIGETFDKNILSEALVQREYANIQEFKAKEEGNESYIPEQHNYDLAKDGNAIISDYIKEEYSKNYPEEIAITVQKYLTTDEMLAHIAKHLGFTDLIKAVEYPLEERTLADSFKALVAALSLSSDLERAQLFVKDFVIAQMNGKDIYDIWTPEKPYEYVVKLLEQRGIKKVEPRLCNQSAVNTILANYQVGLYDSNNKSLLGIGWGENVQIAKDTAALDAIQRLYNSYARK